MQIKMETSCEAKYVFSLIPHARVLDNQNSIRIHLSVEECEYRHSVYLQNDKTGMHNSAFIVIFADLCES